MMHNSNNKVAGKMAIVRLHYTDQLVAVNPTREYR